MGKQTPMETRFRERVRREREHRGWSQMELASLLRDKGLPYMMGSTVAKMETGNRTVRVDEASVLADLFGLSVDIMLGRGRNDTDLAWAVSKLSGNAQKTVADVMSLRERVSGDLEDAQSAGLVDGDLTQQAAQVVVLMSAVEAALVRLANQFPLPT